MPPSRPHALLRSRALACGPGARRPASTSTASQRAQPAALDCAPPWRVITPPPQGSSLGFELCCLKPSSLNRPHPSRSQAHRDFAAWRLIRDAFAMRERIGDPRAVPGFRCSFRPDMPPSLTSGSSTIVSIQNTDVDIGLRYGPKGSALPIIPQSVSRGARFSRLRWFATATACQVAGPPCTGSDQSPSQRGLLLPGFRRVGHPSRRWSNALKFMRLRK